MKDMRPFIHKVLGNDLTPGEVLRGLRVEAGVSQEQLQDITGIQRTNISALENDRIPMTSQYADVFAAALSCHPADILYPNRKFEKTDELRKVEKRAEALFKRAASAR